MGSKPHVLIWTCQLGEAGAACSLETAGGQDGLRYKFMIHGSIGDMSSPAATWVTQVINAARVEG